MSTWEDVQREARSIFVLDSDEAHEFALTVPVPGGQDRQQRVMVRHYRALDEDMLEVRSAIAQAADADPNDMLEKNLSLTLGAIAKHGRFYVLVHRLVLRHTSVEGVIFTLTRTAHVADWLEASHGGDRF